MILYTGFHDKKRCFEETIDKSKHNFCILPAYFVRKVVRFVSDDFRCRPRSRALDSCAWYVDPSTYFWQFTRVVFDSAKCLDYGKQLQKSTFSS